MTLHIIFSVISMHTEEYDITELVENDNVVKKQLIATRSSKW
jgi:hypothetical protein